MCWLAVIITTLLGGRVSLKQPWQLTHGFVFCDEPLNNMMWNCWTQMDHLHCLCILKAQTWLEVTKASSVRAYYLRSACDNNRTCHADYHGYWCDFYTGMRWVDKLSWSHDRIMWLENDWLCCSHSMKFMCDFTWSPFSSFWIVLDLFSFLFLIVFCVCAILLSFFFLPRPFFRLIYFSLPSLSHFCILHAVT